MNDVGFENGKNIFIVTPDNLIEKIYDILNRYNEIYINYFNETRKIWPKHTAYQRAMDFLLFCKEIIKNK